VGPPGALRFFGARRSRRAALQPSATFHFACRGRGRTTREQVGGAYCRLGLLHRRGSVRRDRRTVLVQGSGFQGPPWRRRKSPLWREQWGTASRLEVGADRGLRAESCPSAPPRRLRGHGRTGVEILGVNAPLLLSDSRIRCATSSACWGGSRWTAVRAAGEPPGAGSPILGPLVLRSRAVEALGSIVRRGVAITLFPLRGRVGARGRFGRARLAAQPVAVALEDYGRNANKALRWIFSLRVDPIASGLYLFPKHRRSLRRRQGGGRWNGIAVKPSRPCVKR
jgi:hypothetical protein